MIKTAYTLQLERTLVLLELALERAIEDGVLEEWARVYTKGYILMLQTMR